MSNRSDGNILICKYDDESSPYSAFKKSLSPTSLKQTLLNFSPKYEKCHHNSDSDKPIYKINADDVNSSPILARDAHNKIKTINVENKTNNGVKQSTLPLSILPDNDVFKRPTRSRKKKPTERARAQSLDNKLKTNSSTQDKSKASSVSPKKVTVQEREINSSVINENKQKSKQTQLTCYGIRRTARQYAKEIERQRENDYLTSLKNCIESGMKIVQTEEKGRGIIATRLFYENDFIVEYAGELISDKLAKQRELKYKEDPSIGSYMFFFQDGGQRYCVDATSETPRLGRLINHSRLNPNCIVKVIRLDGVPRLALFAKRLISPGEELLYDYGDRDKESLELHPWLKT